jgi:hypothetical protein
MDSSQAQPAHIHLGRGKDQLNPIRQGSSGARQVAGTGGASDAALGVPPVYELTLEEGESLVVVTDVIITGTFAWRAGEIMRSM